MTNALAREAPARLDDAVLGADVVRRAAVRLVPFLAVLYFISFLDRVNIGFAALQMNASLHISSTEYGAGAGIFFLGYLVFQVPSNIMLQRYGARRWLAVIILAWGVASLSMSFIVSAKQFFIARFVLGAAEAGFFPGLVLYMTYWFPTSSRGRIMAGLLLSVPFATIVGAPISNFILQSFGGTGGWEAWRWLFLIEAIPALCAALLVCVVLPDAPANVAWLSSREKSWLEQALAPQREGTGQGGEPALPGLAGSLFSPKVILYGVVYFGIGMGLYGISLWLPQIIKASGTSESGAVLLTAVPYSVAAVAMMLWARFADRQPANPRNCWIPTLVCMVSLALLPFTTGLTLQLVLLSGAAAGTLSAVAVFWAITTAAFSGRAAGASVAAINTMGSVSGFVGPFAIGWLKEATGHFSAGIIMLAVAAGISALLLLLPAARPGTLASA